jgi:hypothetical protein
MSLTLSYPGLDQIKGPYAGSPAATPMHIIRIPVSITGTYATGGNSVDVCNAFVGPAFVTGASPQGSRMGVTAVNVLWCQAFGDYYDGTNSLTPETLTLSSGGAATSISAASTNNIVLVKLFTGTNGTGGSEVTNATALTGAFGLVIGVQLTYGALGVA